jgi:hypothetical protein
MQTTVLMVIKTELIAARNFPSSSGHASRIITGCMAGITCCLLSSYPAAAAQASAKPTVNVVQAPTKGLVPDVVMDAKGVLHMVYGLEHHAYYVRSTDNGGTFTAPVKVDSTGLVETKMGEPGDALGSSSLWFALRSGRVDVIGQ